MKKYLYLGGILFGIGLLVFSFKDIDFASVGEALSRTHLHYFLLSQLVLLLMLILRGARWQLLFAPGENTPGFKSCFAALNIGITATNVLPARAGELARAIYLKKKVGPSFASIMSSLFWDRFLDALSLLLMITLSLQFTSYELPEFVRTTFLGLVQMVIVLAICAVFAIIFQVHFIRLINWFAEKLSHPFVLRLQNFAVRTLKELDLRGRVGKFFVASAMAVMVWFLELASVQLLMMSLDIGTSWFDSLFVLSIITLATMFPSAPGFVGTIQFGCVLAFGLMSLPKAEAIAFSLLFQLTVFLPATPLGVYYLLADGLKLSELAKEEPQGA